MNRQEVEEGAIGIERSLSRLAEAETKARLFEEAYVETRSALAELRQIFFQRIAAESAAAVRLSQLEGQLSKIIARIDTTIKQREDILRKNNEHRKVLEKKLTILQATVKQQHDNSLICKSLPAIIFSAIKTISRRSRT